MALPVLSTTIGHRGAAKYAPENTLSSLRKAFELGAHWVEFDVMLTADEQPIVFHDEWLERTSNGNGAVSRLSLEEIRCLDAGAWFAPEYKGEQVPTLNEWLALAAELGLSVNIELKASLTNISIMVQQTLASVARVWPATMPIPLYSSACLETLRYLQVKSPESVRGLISDEWCDDWFSIISELGCVSWHVNENCLTPARVQQVKAANVLLLAYTVNDVMRLHELLAMGVDAVFTDDPLLATAL